MRLFDIAFDELIGIEGGYSNDPDDRGGETYKGIARKFWADWDGWVIIDNAKSNPGFPKCLKDYEALDELVRIFYKKEFWDKLKLDEIEQIDKLITLELFDTAVNQGQKTAAMYLQESLNLLNRNEKDYQDIRVDGAIGNATLTVLRANQRRYNVLKCLNGLQFDKYYQLAKNNPTQEKYFNGWLTRVWEDHA